MPGRGAKVLFVIAVIVIGAAFVMFKVKVAVLGFKYVLVLGGVLLLITWLSGVFRSRDPD